MPGSSPRKIATNAAADPGAPEERSAPQRAVDFGDLPEHLGYMLRRAQLKVFQDFNETVAALELSPVQYSVLKLVAANPGLKQSDLASALGIKRANMVVLMHEMEERNLARRRPSATDRRSHGLYLTEEGSSVLTRADGLLDAHQARVTACLGQDGKRQLLALLARVQKLGR